MRLHPEPRVYRQAREVHEDIDCEHEEGQAEHERLEGGEVAVGDGFHQEAAHAWELEEGLHDDAAGYSLGSLHAENSHRGNGGVPERVLEDHTPRLEPLGPRGADIVLPE